MKTYIYYATFLIILVLGFFLRAQETLSRNFLFLIDQGRDMMAVKSIIFDHHLTLIGPYTSLGGVFQGPLWYYLLAVPTYIASGDPWGSVILMLIISITVLFVVFFLTRKYFGTVTALVATFLFAVSPEAQAAATYSWNPHPMHLLIVLYIFVLYHTIRFNQKFHFLLWPIISLMFHFETAMGVFIFVSILLYFLVFQRPALKNKYFPYAFILSFVFFIPQILFEVRHNFLMTKSILQIFTGTSNQGLYVGGENTGYFNLIHDHLKVFYNNFASGFPQNLFLQKLPSLILLFFMIIIFFIKKSAVWNINEKKFLTIISTVVFLNILLSFIYPFPIRNWFLTGFQSFYIIIFAVLLSPIRKFIFGKYILTIFICSTLIVSINRLDLLYFHPPNDGGMSKIKGKLQALDVIYKDAHGEPFGLLIFTPPVNTDAYDYLIWWYGERKYHYIPHHERKGTFYLLMELDPHKPWSYKGWMETVVIKGKIIKTETLPSGLIIQKRVL